MKNEPHTTELDTCDACNGTGSGRPHCKVCMRCRGAGKLTVDQLQHANWCSRLLDKRMGQ